MCSRLAERAQGAHSPALPPPLLLSGTQRRVLGEGGWKSRWRSALSPAERALPADAQRPPRPLGHCCWDACHQCGHSLPPPRGKEEVVRSSKKEPLKEDVSQLIPPRPLREKGPSLPWASGNLPPQEVKTTTSFTPPSDVLKALWNSEGLWASSLGDPQGPGHSGGPQPSGQHSAGS